MSLPSLDAIKTSTEKAESFVNWLAELVRGKKWGSPHPTFNSQNSHMSRLKRLKYIRWDRLIWFRMHAKLRGV
jgi:hypothetical protein